MSRYRVGCCTHLEQIKHVQRLFSVFPDGLPGVALLSLRGSVVMALIGDCLAHRLALSIWLHAAAILVSIALTLGLFTPLAVIAAMAVHVVVWFFMGPHHPSPLIIASLDSIALALLGPGAYSIDGYRFGRRVVVLPPAPSQR